ncbi:hypothetical protein D3C71_1824690 [compost metagenome]
MLAQQIEAHLFRHINFVLYPLYRRRSVDGIRIKSLIKRPSYIKRFMIQQQLTVMKLNLPHPEVNVNLVNNSFISCILDLNDHVIQMRALWEPQGSILERNSMLCLCLCLCNSLY